MLRANKLCKQWYQNEGIQHMDSDLTAAQY
jgi:hypothetical protein